MHILHFLHEIKMILELTKDNLLKNGIEKEQIEKFQLLNRDEDETFQCNVGNFYISVTENKFYTGIDFYRMNYFNNGNLRFPYNCPDLVNEYFDLALVEFLEKQKTILGILFDRKEQVNNFISNEIKTTQQRIESQKEFLLKMKHHKFESKENDIQICEGYINYLKKKEQPEVVNPDEVYKTQNLFKVGLLFATGEMNKYFTINNLNEIVLNNGLSPLKIAKKLGNPSFEKIILASKNNYKEGENKVKNIFNNLDMMNKIIDHCKAKKIEIDPYFISRLPIE